MTLYLVKGKVSVTLYMNGSKKTKELRIVDAEDQYAAQRKFRDYFENKSEQYGDSYTVLDCNAHGIIT